MRRKINTTPIIKPLTWDRNLSVITSIIRNKKKLIALNKHITGSFSAKPMTGNESIWEEISNINGSIPSITYFMLGVLPGFILSWFYEVIHTFFVVTGQIVSYLTMVFWLFVFLFMFFVVERQETYFQERKKFRQDLLKKIQNIKK